MLSTLQKAEILVRAGIAVPAMPPADAGEARHA